MAQLPQTRTRLPNQQWGDTEDGSDEQAFKPLTREEASALRQKQPPLSPWWVLTAQLAVGVGVALLTVLLTRRVELGWSVLYGAACVVVPGALLAYGISSQREGMPAGARVGRFLLWEVVKVACAVAMLVLAPQLVQHLSWPALLAGLVLCMKVYWLPLLWRRRPRTEARGN